MQVDFASWQAEVHRSHIY